MNIKQVKLLSVAEIVDSLAEGWMVFVTPPGSTLTGSLGSIEIREGGHVYVIVSFPEGTLTFNWGKVARTFTYISNIEE